MQELRFVAVSEDGSYAVLAVPGRSGRYILPIDERLRAVAQGQTSRLAQYEIEVESPLRPKEIQARIRAGETAEEIADAAGIPVERVRWFEGPVLAERGYIAQQAQAASVRRAGDSSGPGPRLDDIVTARLSAAGTDPADGQWDSRKRGDGNWQVSLTFPSGGRLHVAEWVFDPRRRHVMPDDDNAARLSLPESELPPEPVSLPGEATVTPIASRLGAAAGMGGGSVSAPGGYAGSSGMSRFKPERSVIPDRSLGGDRSLADRPVAPPAPAPSLPAPERSGGAERPAASRPERSDRPDRAERPERSGHQERSASYNYAEFPESAPYRFSAPTPEPPAYRAPAQEPTGYRPTAEPHAYRDAEPDPYLQQAVPQPAGYPEPAARRPPADPEPPAEQFPLMQAASGPAIDDAERVRPTPPRPVVFEDPEPALHEEQLELTPPAQSAQSPASAPEAAGAPASSPATAGDSGTEAAPARTAASAPANTRAESAAAGQVSAATAERARPASAEPVRPAATEQVPPAPAEQTRSAAAAANRTAEPAVQTPEATEAKQAAPAKTPTTPAHAAAPAASATPAAASAQTSSARTAESASPATPTTPTTPTTQAPVAPAASTAGTAAPEAAAPEAATAEPAAAAVAAGDPAPDAPATAEEQSGRPRPGAKKNPKGRRSSVPSWDEIMLGSSRARD